MLRVIIMLFVVSLFLSNKSFAQEIGEDETEELEDFEGDENEKLNVQVLIDVEGNIFFDAQSQIGIFRNEMSELRVSSDLSSEHGYTMRFRAGARIACKHDVLFLYAPLQQIYTGQLNEEVTFNNSTFNAFEPTIIVSTFNSYRLTYRYFFLWGSRTRMAAGFTGMYNNESVFVRQGEEVNMKSVDGFIPAVHIYAEYKLADRTSILFEGDGLISSTDRFLDYQIAIPYQLTDNLTARIGYRMLEGVSGVDQTFVSPRFHYGLLGLGLNF